MRFILKKYMFAALFTAIIAICAQISIPFPAGVPLTLQVFAICLCGFCLELRYAFLSVVVYILFGFFGLPVFSAFSGGAAVLFGKSGGFIFGFLFVAVFCALSQKFNKSPTRFFCGLLGILLCHILGVAYFSFIFKVPFFHSLIVTSLPYIVKDMICLALALFVSRIIKRRLRFN